MDIITIFIRWFEGFVAQGTVIVRVLPDIVVLPLLGAMGVVSLGVFFWIDDQLSRQRIMK